MANTAQDQENLRQQILANPAAVEALKSNAAKPSGGRMAYITPDKYFQSTRDVLKKFGINVPGDQGAGIDPKTGDVIVNHLSWWQRNADWALPVAVIGGGAAIGALAGGAPAAIGGDSALPTLGSLAGGAGDTGFLASDIGGVANSVNGVGTEALGAGPALPSVPHLASGANPYLAAATQSGGGSTLGSILRYGVPGVTSLLANHELNSSNNDANAALQQATQQGLGINQGIYDTSLGAARDAYNAVSGGYAPYQAVGQQGLNSLASLAGVNRPDLQRRADFTLPTEAELHAMPGYQAGLNERIRGVNASAAARGGLLTGGAVKAAEKAAGDYADQNYATLANLASNAYGLNTTNDLNVYNANAANFDRPFSRAATLASLGQYGTTGAANAANNLAAQTINAGGQYGQNATNLLTAGANANAANSVVNGRNTAGTYTTLGNLIQDYLANRGY